MTDPAKYKLNHTMIRIRDPKASIAFYEHLGMSVLQEFHLPDYKLDLYFLAYDYPESVSHGKHTSDREGVIELSHEYAIEKAYYGNEDSKGFSHICVSVDSVQAACERLSSAGYTSQKHPQDGYAFIQDPDKNWVKLIPQNPVCDTESVTTTDVQGYKMNHTMLRIEDKDASLRFYQDVFCMKLKHTFRNPEAGYDCYFLGYHLPGERNEIDTPESHADSEGLLVLTWKYETESEDGVVHRNGRSEGEGFGHICISVDDIILACERFDKKGVSWQKRLMDGPFRVAFMVDPNGYLVEIIQNEKYRPAGHEF